MTDIIWEEPPAPQRRGRPSEVEPFAELLKERPGVWARWPKEYRTAGGADHAKSQLMKLGAETAVRKIDAKVFRMFARWPGDTPAE